MTDLEQLSVNVQRQIDAQNARIDSVLAKVDMFVVESQQQREDIRQMNAKIDSKFDSISNQIHNLTIAAVVGFGAIALAVGGLVATALK